MPGTHWMQDAISRPPGITPKVHGEIEGNPPGTSYQSRRDCSNAGVHGPLQAGIHGTAKDGAYSVVLSLGYEDDEDHGEWFIYTGQGGRGTEDDDKDKLDKMMGKKKWDGVQREDQEWVRGNKALQLSSRTKDPVRVIRGRGNLKNDPTRYAPPEGYRYDGLYVVEEAWRAPGENGFMTCRFRMRRLPGQPPLPGEPTTTSSANTRIEPPAVGPSGLRPSTNVSNDPALTPERSKPVAKPYRVATGVSNTFDVLSTESSRILIDQPQARPNSTSRPAPRPSVPSADLPPMTTIRNEGHRKFMPSSSRVQPKPAVRRSVGSEPRQLMRPAQVPPLRMEPVQSRRDQLMMDIFDGEDSDDEDDVLRTRSDGAVAQRKRKRTSWSDRGPEIVDFSDSEPAVADSEEGQVSSDSNGLSGSPDRWVNAAGKKKYVGLKFNKKARIDGD